MEPTAYENLFKKDETSIQEAIQEFKKEELSPYPQGEWLKLERSYKTTDTVLMSKSYIASFISGTEGDEDEEMEGEETIEEDYRRKAKRDRILRGPLWNYGLRKLTTDSDYYQHVLFGMHRSSLQTPEDMVLKGAEWIATKPISASLGFHLLKRIKKMHPDKTALFEWETGRTLTYGQLGEKVEALAHGLRWLGLKTGQVLAIVSFNSLEAHLMVLASLLIGSIAALVDSTINPVEMGIVLRITIPHLVFTETGKTQSKVETAVSYFNSFHQKVPKIIVNSSTLPDSRYYFTFEQLLRQVGRKQSILGPMHADYERPVFILYSGPTDKPKACLIPERAFTYSKTFVEAVLTDTDESSITVLFTPPLSWTLTIKSLLNHFVDGHRIVFFRGQVPAPCLITALRQLDVFAMLTMRDTMIKLLEWPARPRCPQLKLLAITGIPLRLKNVLRAHEELFKKQVQILQIYGIPEMGSTTANTFLNNKLGSVGKLFFNVQMKVMEECSGMPLGPCSEGELCFKSPTMMLGYYNNAEANVEAFDSEGFLHTGDLGYYDERGFVYINDRIRDVIKWRTYLVSPSLVETVLLDQPEIKEALVFGMFDEEDGQVVTAAVIFEINHENTDVTALEKRVNDLLPYNRKIRGGIHVFNQFPHSSLGKPVKEPVVKEVLDRVMSSNQRDTV